MLTIDRDHLESLASAAARVAKDRSPSPAASGVLLKYDSGVLRFEATDFDRRLVTSAYVKHPPNVAPWSALVTASTFRDAARVMPVGKPVKLAPDFAGAEVAKLRMTGGTRERVMSTIAITSYPEALIAPTLDGALEIDGGALLRLIDGVGWAVAVNETSRLWMTGIRLQWSPDRIVASATTGYVVASMQIPGTGKGSSGDLVLSHKAAKSLGAAGKDATDEDAAALEVGPGMTVKISGNDRIVRVDTGSAMLLSLALGDARSLPRSDLSGPRIVLDRAELLAAAKALRSFDAFKITLAHGEAVLTANSEHGQGLDKIPGAEGFEGFRVTLMTGQILGALARLECARVALVVDGLVNVAPFPLDPTSDNIMRIVRVAGDDTPGAPEVSASCAVCSGERRMLAREGRGTVLRPWSSAKACHVRVEVILDGKPADGDAEIACPVCAGGVVPEGHALLRAGRRRS